MPLRRLLPAGTRLRRSLLRIGIAAVLLHGVAACREKGRSSAQPDTPKGRIIAITDSMLVHGSTDTIRFGRLGSGEIAVQRFWIENKTPKPIVIVSTRRSCGCTSLDFDKQPIAPGKTRRMEMTFDSRGKHGWQLKNLEIRFAGENRPLRLLVEADVE